MYDSDPAAVTTALQGSSSAVYTTDVINTILALTSKDNNPSATIQTVAPSSDGTVTVAAGTEVVMISQPATGVTIKPPANAPVVIFQGTGGVNVDFSSVTSTVVSGTGPDRLVVGSAGNDSIILDSRNTRLILGSGDSTVVANTGHDTIQAGLGNSTIVGGGGTIVQLIGSASDYSVTVTADHHALITKFLIGSGREISGALSAGAVVAGAAQPAVHTDLDNVQYVQLANNTALILANDSKEAAVATLFHSVFGRDADAGGLQYWFAAAGKGASLLDIANNFIQSSEYQAIGQLSDQQFISNLYLNTFNRAADAGGLQYWADALGHGATRADLLVSFAQVAAATLDGSQHVEAVVVGAVTIVQGIV